MRALVMILNRGGYKKFERVILIVRLRKFKNKEINYTVRRLCEELNYLFSNMMIILLSKGMVIKFPIHNITCLGKSMTSGIVLSALENDLYTVVLGAFSAACIRIAPPPGRPLKI